MAVEEVERAMPVNLMQAVEELDIRELRNAELGEEATHFRILVGDPFIRRHAVTMASFDHERPWRDERGEFGIAESVGEVERENLVLAGENVGGPEFIGGDLAWPVVERGGADATVLAITDSAKSCAPIWMKLPATAAIIVMFFRFDSFIETKAGRILPINT